MSSDFKWIIESMKRLGSDNIIHTAYIIFTASVLSRKRRSCLQSRVSFYSQAWGSRYHDVLGSLSHNATGDAPPTKDHPGQTFQERQTRKKEPRGIIGENRWAGTLYLLPKGCFVTCCFHPCRSKAIWYNQIFLANTIRMRKVPVSLQTDH